MTKLSSYALGELLVNNEIATPTFSAFYALIYLSIPHGPLISGSPSGFFYPEKGLFLTWFDQVRVLCRL